MRKKNSTISSESLLKSINSELKKEDPTYIAQHKNI